MVLPARGQLRRTGATLGALLCLLVACRPAAIDPAAQRVHPAINQISPPAQTPAAARSPAPEAARTSPAPQNAAPADAAALLAAGDPEGALQRLSSEPEAAAETPAWFVQGMLRGRAARLAGRPADAVLALEPLAAVRRPPRGWPSDLVLHELAQALVERAKASPAEADGLLQRAASLWSRAIDHEPVRTAAPMRVAQARALAAVRGAGQAAERAAARRAVKALTAVLRDYPNHPDEAELSLLRAEALLRAGDREGPAALRRVAIEAAGTPAAEAAEAALRGLGKPPRYTVAEQLDRATAARRLRRYEFSKQVLTDMLQEPGTSGPVREAALRSRAWTASRAHDFSGCADDLGELYRRSRSADLRDDLLRCLDKAGRYDEALAIWLELAGRKGGAGKAALWQAIEQATRGGRYAKARELLAKVPAKERQRGERLWLDAWLDYRLGELDAAADKFALAERRLPTEQAKSARYFRGRALLAAPAGVEEGEGQGRAEGERLLRQLATDDALGYHGLMARQRLLDAGLDPGPAPTLSPLRSESEPAPDHASARATLDSLAERFGAAFPALVRAAALHAAGWTEETRRELRAAVDAYEDLFGLDRGGWVPRHEDIIAGLSWKATWKQPRLALPKEARKLLRERGAVEALREGLHALTWALDEPYRKARLTPASAGVYKARWHPRAFRAAVEREAAARSVDPTHLWALMYTESRFRRHVVSSAGARGAIQIMPWTGEQLAARLGEPFDVDALFDIDTNVHLSAYYLAELLFKFHGQPALAYASYNGGPFNVERWLVAKGAAEGGARPLELDAFIAEIPFRETANYTRRVLEVQAAYALLYGGGLPRWTNELDLRVEANIDF